MFNPYVIEKIKYYNRCRVLYDSVNDTWELIELKFEKTTIVKWTAPYELNEID